jgi:hypothetical protein
MRFYCACDPPKPGGEIPNLIIEAPTAHDAKMWAQRKLGGQGLFVNPIGECDFELRYVGNDYSKGGTPDGRHLEVREKKTDGTLGEWRRA